MTIVVDLFAIAVGFMILAMWASSLATHRVPELVSSPWEIRAHISAESIMAVTLIGGGVTSRVGIAEGPSIVLLGFGMTLYSIVNSAGYFAQRRQLPAVLLFAILLVLVAIAAGVQLSAIVG